MTWAVAARFITIGEAVVARSALDAAGIDCDLVDEEIVGINWCMSQAVGGIKVIVPEEDLEAAREIITNVAANAEAELIAEERAVAPPLSCPACGSPHLEALPRLRSFVLIAAAFIGIGVAVGQTQLALAALAAVAIGALLMPSLRCTACEHRWSPTRRENRVEAPPPDERDTIEEQCPRCGSRDVYRIDYRRLKAIPLLFNPAILFAVPLWLLGPKRRCESCGLKM